MVTKRKPRKKDEPIDVSAKLAEALAEKPTPEKREPHEVPQVGDMVRIGSNETEYRVSHVSQSGREVNLEFPGTNIERYRVPVDSLTIAGRTLRKPREPEEPMVDVGAVRDRIEEAQQSVLDHIREEIAALKKFLRGKGISASELDEFTETAATSWKQAVETIEEKLDK